MSRRSANDLPASAERLLRQLAAAEAAPVDEARPAARVRAAAGAVEPLLRADLVVRNSDGRLSLSAAGRAHLNRSRILAAAEDIDPFLGQHLALARRQVDLPQGRCEVKVNDAESPLAWLARRRGRDGRPLIDAAQLQAGERLRAQFTRARLAPRLTVNWESPVSDMRRNGPNPAAFTDAAVAARIAVQRALAAVGPEFSGLLLDVCCFLKGLEEVERERGWPPRCAKVVLQLALDRLARHYGLAAEARGRQRAPLRAWLAADAAFTAERE